MKEVLINCLSVPNSLLPVWWHWSWTHSRPVPATLMLGSANRGCWRDTARRYPSFSFLLLLLLSQWHQLAGQVGRPAGQMHPLLKSPDQDWVGCPTSLSLLFNLSDICFLQLLLSQLLQVNNSCSKMPLRLPVWLLTPDWTGTDNKSYHGLPGCLHQFQSFLL